MIEMIGGEVSVDALADGEVFVGGAQVLEADVFKHETVVSML